MKMRRASSGVSGGAISSGYLGVGVRGRARARARVRVRVRVRVRNPNPNSNPNLGSAAKPCRPDSKLASK